MNNNHVKAGDIVYVFIRNPHTQDVANVQEAAVVKNPENEKELAVFIYETYYPITEDTAIYTSKAEAEEAYAQYFGEHTA
nr:transcriptional regulator SplA domain-containing protein [Lysinibacillus timonensis]